MTRFNLLILPTCLILTACGGSPRPIPDISHARVWHVNDDAARNLSQYGAAHYAPATNHTSVQFVSHSQHQTHTDAPLYHQAFLPSSPAAPTLPQASSYVQPKKQVASIFNRQSNDDFLPIIMQAENQSSGYVKSILAKSREMTLYRKEIIQGGCWDYLDAAWTRAGVTRNMRQTVYKSQHGGAYAHVDDLRVGDWIYHVNHSYHNIEHSGMFIGWVDKSRNLGLTLSYAGEGRKEPARYKVYDLSSVYNIMRAPN